MRGKRGFDVFCEGEQFFVFPFCFCFFFVFFCIIGGLFFLSFLSFLSVIWVAPSIVE